MAKGGLTEIQMMDALYAKLSHNLKMFRQQYFQLQDQYPPESEYLIQQLIRLETVLSINKSEIIELSKMIKALREEQARNKKRNVFLRLVG